MALSYNRMWKLLVDKKMSKADLRKAADIAPNTMTKLRRDETVNLAILGRICETLDCDFGDIMEYVKESKNSSNTQTSSKELQKVWFWARKYMTPLLLAPTT